MVSDIIGAAMSGRQCMTHSQHIYYWSWFEFGTHNHYFWRVMGEVYSDNFNKRPRSSFKSNVLGYYWLQLQIKFGDFH